MESWVAGGAGGVAAEERRALHSARNGRKATGTGPWERSLMGESVGPTARRGVLAQA